MQRALIFLLVLVALLVPSGARAQDCSRAVALPDIQALLKQAEKAIYLVQFDGAVVALDEAEQLIPCLTEVVTRDELTRLFLFRGVVSFNQNNEVAATAAFRRALAIDTALRWNERFGQKPRELFLDAKAEVVAAPRGKVRLPRANEGVIIYIDAEAQPAEGGERELFAGRHLLQVFHGEALIAGLWLELPGGGVVQPPLPPEAGKMEAAQPAPVAGGGDSPSDRSWMRPAGLGAMGAGVVSAGVGVAGGVIYLQSAKALNDGTYFSNRDDAEKEALLQRNKVGAIMADVGLPAAAVLAGAGAALFLLSRPDEDPSSAALVPFFGPGGGGLALTLAF